MNIHSTKNSLARWLPLLVGICVAMPIIVLWWNLAAKERANIERTVRSDAERVENEITERLRQQSLAFVRMARRRELLGEPEKKIWEDDARLYYEHFPGTRGVTYVDRSYRIRWLIPVEGNEPALGLYLGFETRRLQAMEESRRLREVRITAPIELVQGGKGIIIFAPFFVGGRFEGFIDGVYRTQDFLDSILRNIAPGYVISVRAGDEEIFRRGEAADSVAMWAQERTISLYGAEWRVRVVPTRAFLGGMYSAVDVLPIAGVAMALIFALIVRLAQTTRRRGEESKGGEYHPPSPS